MYNGQCTIDNYLSLEYKDLINRTILSVFSEKRDRNYGHSLGFDITLMTISLRHNPLFHGNIGHIMIANINLGGTEDTING